MNLFLKINNQIFNIKDNIDSIKKINKETTTLSLVDHLGNSFLDINIEDCSEADMIHIINNLKNVQVLINTNFSNFNYNDKKQVLKKIVDNFVLTDSSDIRYNKHLFQNMCLLKNKINKDVVLNCSILKKAFDKEIKQNQKTISNINNAIRDNVVLNLGINNQKLIKEKRYLENINSKWLKLHDNLDDILQQLTSFSLTNNPKKFNIAKTDFFELLSKLSLNNINQSQKNIIFIPNINATFVSSFIKQEQKEIKIKNNEPVI